MQRASALYRKSPVPIEFDLVKPVRPLRKRILPQQQHGRDEAHYVHFRTFEPGGRRLASERTPLQSNGKALRYWIKIKNSRYSQLEGREELFERG